MESTPTRRSSRPRSGKSALELLGLSPRSSSSAGKNRKATKDSPKVPSKSPQCHPPIRKDSKPSDKKVYPSVADVGAAVKRGRGRPRKRPLTHESARDEENHQSLPALRDDEQAAEENVANPDSQVPRKRRAVDNTEKTSYDAAELNGHQTVKDQEGETEAVLPGVTQQQHSVNDPACGEKGDTVLTAEKEQQIETDADDQQQTTTVLHTVMGQPGQDAGGDPQDQEKTPAVDVKAGSEPVLRCDSSGGAVDSVDEEGGACEQAQESGPGEQNADASESVDKDLPLKTDSEVVAPVILDVSGRDQESCIKITEVFSWATDGNHTYSGDHQDTSRNVVMLGSDNLPGLSDKKQSELESVGDTEVTASINKPRETVPLNSHKQVFILKNVKVRNCDDAEGQANEAVQNVLSIQDDVHSAKVAMETDRSAVHLAEVTTDGDSGEQGDVIPVEIADKAQVAAPGKEAAEEVIASTDWMTVADEQNTQHVRVKVKQGSQVIPVHTRRSQRQSKPSQKKQALTESLLQLYDSIKPKDVMLENIIAWGDMDGRSKMKCKHCHVELSDREDFEKHITQKHSDLQLKPWQCPVCYYRVSEKTSLKQHMAAHTEVKQYACEECGHMFGSKSKLNQHMKYHRDIRDQECPLCDRAFHEYKTLNTHLLQVHKTTKLKALKDHIEIQGKPLLKQARLLTIPVVTFSTACQAVQSETVEVMTQASATVSDDTSLEMEVENVMSDEGDTYEASVQKMATDGSTVQEEVIAPCSQEVQVAVENLYEGQEQGSEGVPLSSDDTAGTQASKRHLPGTYKTKHNTEMFKLGLSGVESKPKLAKKEFPRPMIKPEAGIAISKKGRWINNQRYVRVDQMEPAIRQYADIFPGDIGVRVILKCKLCGLSVPSKCQFTSHLEKDHPDLKPWKCDECNYSTRRRTSLIVHKKIHSGEKEFECSLCEMKFAFKQKLTNHMKHHENKREHVCDTCGKGFNEKSDLTKHVRRVHMGLRPYACEQCDKAYKESYQLKRHLETHTGVKNHQCPHCKKFYLTKISLSQHMKSHTCMFHCEICQKSFGSYSGFMAHKVMHDESYGGYKCDICGKTLHTKGSLIRHKTVAHSDERPFICEICSRGYKTKKDLRNHKTVHSDVKDFSCTVCDYKAKRIENLRVHMRRHATTKPFKCGVCGRDYTQRRALELHLRHHVTTGHVDSKTCIKCGTAFQYPEIYEEHIQTCQGKTAMTVKDEMLEVEVETSSGQSTTLLPREDHVTVFMCEECNSVFATQDSLAVHILAEHMKQNTTAATVTGQSADSQQTALIIGSSSTQSAMESAHVEQITDNMQAIISIPGSEELTQVTIPKEQYVSLITQDMINNEVTTTSTSSHYVTVTDPATSMETIVSIEGLTGTKQVEEDVVTSESVESFVAVAETVEGSGVSE